MEKHRWFGRKWSQLFTIISESKFIVCLEKSITSIKNHSLPKSQNMSSQPSWISPPLYQTSTYPLEVTQKFFICSLDAVCRALWPKKIFLAFEGHKGRKAKKGQNFRKNKYGSKCLELPNSARNQIKIFSPL